MSLEQEIKFRQDINFELDVGDEVLFVRLTTSDSKHQRLKDYGNCDIYMHLTTKEEKINSIVFDELQAIYDFLEQRKNQGKKKDRPFKINIAPEPEKLELYIRRTQSTKDMPIKFLLELMERLLDYLDYVLDVNNQNDFSQNYHKEESKVKTHGVDVFEGHQHIGIGEDEEDEENQISDEFNSHVPNTDFNKSDSDDYYPKEIDSESDFSDYSKKSEQHSDEYHPQETQSDHFEKENDSEELDEHDEDDEDDNVLSKENRVEDEDDEESDFNNAFSQRNYNDDDFKEVADTKETTLSFEGDDDADGSQANKEFENFDDGVSVRSIENVQNQFDDEQIAKDIDALKERMSNKVEGEIPQENTIEIPLSDPDGIIKEETEEPQTHKEKTQKSTDFNDKFDDDEDDEEGFWDQLNEK